MKKIRNHLYKILFFLPAIIITSLVIWIFVYPYMMSAMFSDISIPLAIWFLLAGFWLSGIFLSFHQFYGGIFAMIMPIWDYVGSLYGTAGHRHIDTLPYLLFLFFFYSLCGYIAYKAKHILKS